jgi:hypothetical protein
MSDLGPVGPNLWRFCLVPAGARHLWIWPHRARTYHDLGTQVAGYVKTLSLGDAVYDQPLKKNRRLMFRLDLRGGRPVMTYGKTYGPQPRRQVALETLGQETYANAGLEPGVKEEGA